MAQVPKISVRSLEIWNFGRRQKDEWIHVKNVEKQSTWTTLETMDNYAKMFIVF